MRTFSFAPRSTFLLLPPLLVALAGCSESGALGQASIQGGCAGSTLPCASASEVDAPLAVGASMPISVNLNVAGGGQPPLDLVSTDTTVFTVAQETVMGVGPGLATLLISSEGEVIDFVAVWVQKPTAISVSRLSSSEADIGEIPGDLGLLVGDTITVAVGPVGSNQALTGTAPTTWTVADPTIVTALDEGVVGRANLVARAAGTTTVTASAFGLEQSFTVEVTK